MSPKLEYAVQYKFPADAEAEAEEFSDFELEEEAALLVEALTLPPPPAVIARD